MSTIRPFPKPFAVELLSMIVKEVAGNDQGVWRETLKNLSLVGSVLEGPAQKLLLGKVAVFEGNDDLSDEVDNAFYGIEVQNHGVTDPSQEVKFRGFNRWCAEIRDPDPDPNSFRHGPPSYFSTIKYTRGGNCDVIPGARSEKYLLAFTKVKKLRLEKVVLDPLEDPRYMPRFGACLGGQIRTLILKNCQMDINRFVCYLSLFPCLTSLRIDHPVITDADWILPDQPLPKFNENLQLDLPATGAVEFLRVLNNSDACLDMNYSQITINYTGSHPIPHHTKDFLSKSSHSLTHLQIDSRLGDLDLSGMNHLQMVVIHSNEIVSIWPIVEDLPLEKVSLLLLIPLAYFTCRTLSPGRRAWLDDLDTSLDRKLHLISLEAQHLGRDYQQSRFYISSTADANYDDDKMTRLLPKTIRRVHLDKSLRQLKVE